MNDLQITIIDLIQEIDEICRKYDITYYASGGTVIGAFRHGGFIPWDDDADLYMTRDNYHKFLKAFHKENPKGRSFGTLEEDINYPGTITHYRNNENTSFVTRYHTLNSCDAGVVVDIFILDPVGDNPKQWEEHIGKLKVYADINFPFYAYVNCGNSEYMPLYLEYAKKVEKYGKKSVNEELEQELFTYPEEEATHYILRWGTLPHVFRKEMFEKPVYVDYENVKLPMPTLWYDYLVQLYGYNWNEIPQNIISEGHTAVISTEHRYTNYLLDTDRFINKEEAYKMYFQRKELLIRREMLRRPFIEKFLRLKGKYIVTKQNQYLETNNVDVEQLFKDKKYSEIIQHFNLYLTTQFDQYYVGKMTHNHYYRLNNPIFIELSINQLRVLMCSLYYQSDYNRLNKMIFMCKRTGIVENFVNQLENKLQKIHYIMSLYYEKKYQETLEFIAHNGEQLIDESERIAQIFYSSRIYCHEVLNQEDIKYLEMKSSQDTKGVWLKLYADYLSLTDENEAISLYKQCISITNDGFILNELEKKYHLTKDYAKKMAVPQICEGVNKVKIDLLDEVVSVFNQHQIDYYLFGDTLISTLSHGNLHNKSTPLEIVIKPEHAKKVIELFKDNEKFSYPLNNPDIITHSMRYCSLDKFYTTITSEGQVEQKDIYVKMTILRKNPDNRLKRYWIHGLNILYRTKLLRKGRFIYKLLAQPIFCLFPKEVIRKYIFDNMIDTSLSSHTDKYRIGKKYYDVKLFEDYEMTKLFDKEYRIPMNVENILSQNMKKVLIKEKLYAESLFTLFDDDIDMLNEIFSKMEDDQQIIENYQKSLLITENLKVYNRQARYNWDIILRAEDRFNLYLKYKNQKEYILQLYKQHQYQDVWEILSDYDRLVRLYLSKNMGICFDKDILDIYLNLLNQRGEEQVAKKLKNLVPQEHLEQIQILDIDC